MLPRQQKAPPTEVDGAIQLGTIPKSMPYNQVMTLWGKIRDAYVTMTAKAAAAERECQHDGTEPQCKSCWSLTTS